MANAPTSMPSNEVAGGVSTIALRVKAIGRRLGLSDGQTRAWSIAAVLLSACFALPAAAVLFMALEPGDGIWAHLSSTVLPIALTNTFVLLSGAGAVTLIAGTGAAWLVTMYRFPGRAIVDRLLVLPLAIPTYIVAYAYVELLDYAGPVQSQLRSAFGFKSPTDYYFPDIRSAGGTVFIFSSVLYPYVYLAARASFVQQSVCVLEVARTLGRTALGAFWSVALPMARPALAAGVALVAMECLNDLGAVQHLGFETLTPSIYATWLQRSNLPGAAQLSSILLILVICLLFVERLARGGAGTQDTTGRQRSIPFETLSGWKGKVALILVFIPFVAGFAIPFGILLKHALAYFGEALNANFFAAARNSLVLASLVSLVSIALALFFGYAARIAKGPLTDASTRFAATGYALPGTVLALGLMIPLAGFDNGVDAWAREHLGISTGLLMSGSLFAITVALVIRFLAVALGSIEAGLQRISPNLDAAARTLGAGSFSALMRVHMPMLGPALAAAALLVFVDAMKELPATLLMRPFNFETLATYVYGLAAVEQFEQASLGAVMIVTIGLVPVLLLHRTIADGSTGRSGS